MNKWATICLRTHSMTMTKDSTKDSTQDSTEDTLTQWLAVEEALLARNRVGSGSLSREKVAAMTGLEVMRAVMNGELPSAPMSATMRYMMVEVEHGRVVVQGAPAEHIMNIQGSVHGGWFGTILDSAVGNAIHTTLPAGKGYATLDLSIKMIRAIFPSVGRVRAIGTVINTGRTICTAEGVIVGPDNKIYAHATTTCLVQDLRS